MRRDLTVRIDAELRAQAREAGINISRFLEAKLEAELTRLEYERRLEEVAKEQAAKITEQLRREGILSENQHVEFVMDDLL